MENYHDCLFAPSCYYYFDLLIKQASSLVVDRRILFEIIQLSLSFKPVTKFYLSLICEI